MNEFLKDTMYTGVGFIAITAEKVQKRIEELNAELVEQTKNSKEEGRRLVDEWMKEWEDRRDEFRQKVLDRKNEFTEDVEETVKEVTNKVKETSTDVAEAMNIPTKDDLEELNEAVDKLEEQMSKKAAPKRAKRVTSSTKTKTSTKTK
jgi:polyhydroxyalkanoate synthesis regulator phasin